MTTFPALYRIIFLRKKTVISYPNEKIISIYSDSQLHSEVGAFLGEVKRNDPSFVECLNSALIPILEHIISTNTLFIPALEETFFGIKKQLQTREEHFDFGNLWPGFFS